ncbi:hypothetical protein J2T56_000182 [Natronobacillus azotifigens]|uniref:Sugar ABC transporter substrate-binding protein n=1 Tax=Natronobacillus azotifigens TaxID=472978 RepID=A0A9J6R8P7_9BACI|nr:hypothetical protein [Natronobacillus azotifigens]MCZ0701612.1 hypothetical protein [Natronobacillus azotifigens]
MNKCLNKIGLLVFSLLLIGLLAACNGDSDPQTNGVDNGANEEQDQGPTQKIGVQIYDATDSELIAFRRYYQDYIEDNYNVEFLFSDSLDTAEAERTSTENFINQGVAAIISFSDSDRMSVIQMTEDAGVYYAIGAGTLSDEQLDMLSDNEYFVGSIGPSLAEEEEVGYDMAKHYIEQGYTNFLLYAGGYPFVDMHLMRTHGMIRALEEVGVTYNAREDGQIGTFESDEYTINTVYGFPDDSGAFFGTVAERVNEPGLEVILTAGLGVEFFGTALAQSGQDIRMGTVASFEDAYYEGFSAGQVDYLAGKFSSSIGPIFAAVYNAINGDMEVVRNNGNPFRIDQGYWIATNVDEFNEMYEMSNSTENPAYTKELLDMVIKSENPDTDYDNFESFVQSYSFDEITNLQD